VFNRSDAGLMQWKARGGNRLMDKGFGVGTLSQGQNKKVK